MEAPFVATASTVPVRPASTADLLLPGGYQQVSITDAVFMTAGDYAQVSCYSWNGNGSSFIYNGGFTATLINSFFGAKPARDPHKGKNLAKPPR
jgi:hypothetical protein